MLAKALNQIEIKIIIFCFKMEYDENSTLGEGIKILHSCRGIYLKGRKKAFSFMFNIWQNRETNYDLNEKDCLVNEKLIKMHLKCFLRFEKALKMNKYTFLNSEKA